MVLDACSNGTFIKRKNREESAIEFYNVLSNMDFVSSTPTLFNSGTLHSQMSSCYINITDDSLKGIFKLYSDNAMLSKWAGGIGTDWIGAGMTGSEFMAPMVNLKVLFLLSRFLMIQH